MEKVTAGIIFSLIVMAIAGIMFFLTPNFVHAQNPEQATLDSAIEKIDKGFGVDLITVTKDVDPGEAARTMVGRAIKILLGIIGTISLIVFIYSGIMWMTSGGVETTIRKAQQSMVWAALGLFVVFISYTIIAYVIKAFAF